MQTGILKITKNNQKGSQIVEPLINTFLYFSQDGIRKVTTKTDAQGQYSFELPIGSYQVSISTGADGNVFPLLGGRLFEMKQDSPTNTFEEWLYNKPTTLNSDLSNIFQNIESNLQSMIEDARSKGQAILASCKEIERNISAKLDIEASNNINADYTLVDFGTMMRNERKVLPNPFGDNVPVLTVVEIYSEKLDKWGRTGEGAGGGFVTGGMILGEGIYVQTGAGTVGVNNPAVSGGVFVPDNPGMAPVRMHVWKIGGSK
ncbi:carboxypeptidase-like regulatory domain-containing protein [Wohlfahrtiimonas sp. G9077]|uniref:carboxypeptidase-like regulatory domain-containing protein n=1 Tax=Wohlfahrtiimonas sp. G9077 TaxID=1980118 RepID=UPI000B9928D3|nr:carboxypeptidase-like regulatory domain-containing protein [Wohlfahrtiimonas sp. G9077]OYQ75481.1 hypothetical protein B9T20_01925 [Wohlfahrtiimonas sp. G9077]